MRVDGEMRKARDDQINHKLNFQAVQAKRERNEFERVIRSQQEQIEKEKREKEKKLAELQVHSTQLRQQIRNKVYVLIQFCIVKGMNLMNRKSL